MIRSAPSCLAASTAQQADGAVADDRHGLARTDLGRHGAEPAGAEHVGGREQARDHVVRRHARRRDQGAVGERDAGVLGLCAGGGTGLPVDARRLVAGPADLAGVVGGEERADDELARLDGRDRAADLLDDADVLVAHRCRLVTGLDAAVGPEVRAAHAGGRQPDDGVGRLDDGRVGALLGTRRPGGRTVRFRARWITSCFRWVCGSSRARGADDLLGREASPLPFSPSCRRRREASRLANAGPLLDESPSRSRRSGGDSLCLAPIIGAPGLGPV